MRFTPTRLCFTTALVAAVQIATPAKAAASAALAEKHRFDIPEQGLAGALLALSQQSDIRILFPYDEVVALRAKPVRGWHSTDDALNSLIAGRSFRRTMTSARTVAIASTTTRTAYASAGTQLADASAVTSGSGGMILTQADTSPAAPPAGSPAATQVAAAGLPDEGTIIVTGTRATNRTVVQSLAPIDVLGKTDLQTSGKQSVRDLLGTLVPSISVSNSGAGASFAVKTLSLRGLAGDQLLVLVNGKRRHNTATLFINGTTQNGQSPPDLDLIPSTSIERIEVLRDGASAQYGSDAIAGVVNVILKKDESGSFTGLFGANGDQGGQTARMQGDIGLPLGENGHVHLSADGYLQGRTIRGTANTSVLYPLINGQPDPREATADRLVNKPGQPQVVGVNLSYDAAYLFAPEFELYSFGTYSKRHADAWLTFRNPNAAGNILQVYPDGYIPHLHIHDQDFQATGGGRGFLGDLHYDLSTSYAKNRVDYDETTALNASLGPASPTDFYIGYVRATEWTSNLDLTDHFEVGLIEPLSVAVGAEYRRNSYSIGAGEPASYIDGAYRSPAGQFLAGTIRQAGSQGVTGFPPSAAGTFKRNNWSAYVNVEQKIVEGVEVALAGRHEDYSDFGKTDTYKASLRVEPIKGVAFRGTASTGFRAPTLQQEHYASSSTIGVLLPGATTTVLAPVRALPVDDPVAVALGAQPLKPEKSKNYSVGVVLTPINRFNLTVDAYQIEIRDRILLSGTFTGAAAANGTLNGIATILRAAGLNPVQSGFFFSNAASTRTRGVDIVATYRADLGDIGTANLSLSANFNKTKFTRLDVPPQLAAIGAVVIDRARQGDYTKGTPRDKYIGNVFLTHGPITLNLRATRYGKVTQVAANQANVGGVLMYVDDTIKPKVIADFEVNYELRKGIKLGAGANNVFNTYPSILSPVNQGLTGFSYYNPYSPYGISGGFYYGKLTFNF